MFFGQSTQTAIFSFIRNTCSVIFISCLLFVSVSSNHAFSATSCYIDTSTRPVIEYCPVASTNYRNSNRKPTDIKYIVIHTVQGSLESAVNVFAQQLTHPRSAHFIVGKDGTVIKSVPVEDIAWHAGTSPPQSNEQFSSQVLNSNSIGIEHGGYVKGDVFPTWQQMVTSAALVRLLCTKYNIPIDRNHIVGHEEIKATKGDPGANWNWSRYMRLVKHGSKTSSVQKNLSPTKAKQWQTTAGGLAVALGGALISLSAIVD